MSQFKREARYVVLKIKDIEMAGLTECERDAFNAVCDKVSRQRISAAKSPLECVVVEKDWPEYEPTWAAIAKRMSADPVDCPHAAPFRYCPTCVASPCPIGLGGCNGR